MCAYGVDNKGVYNEDFYINASFSDLAADPPPPVSVRPAGADWNPNIQMVAQQDGSEQAQLLGKEAAKQRWGMAIRYATKIAPGQKPGPHKGLDDHYHLEALDERHRMSDLLQAMLDDYKKIFPIPFHQKLSIFFLWLNGFIRDYPNDARAMLMRCAPGYPPEAYDAFMKSGVDYRENPFDRFKYLLTLQGGKLYQKGRPFDTQNTKTAFSGQGWAIYVVSPHGHWFAGSHIVGAFHHSSFLGGRPVLAAGEMQVTDGVPKVISAKSGHYKPSMEQFVNGVKLLKDSGINLDATQVAVRDTGTNKKTQIGAIAFLTNSALRNRLNVW